MISLKIKANPDGSTTKSGFFIEYNLTKNKLKIMKNLTEMQIKIYRELWLGVNVGKITLNEIREVVDLIEKAVWLKLKFESELTDVQKENLRLIEKFNLDN